jgi:hypothetical protein
MSEQIQVIEARYGVAGWVSAQPSNLRIDGVPRIEFGFNEKWPIHVELGEAMKVIRELRARWFRRPRRQNTRHHHYYGRASP